MYYLWIKDEQTGPFHIDHVRTQLKTGTIHGETLYWIEGMIDWQPLHAIQHEIEGVPAAMIVSGFWRRLAAFAIDLLLLGFAGFFSGLFLFDFYMSLGPGAIFLGLIVSAAYFGLLNSTIGAGQTLGKRLMTIRVVNAAGNCISPLRSIARYLILSFPFWINKTLTVGLIVNFWLVVLASVILSICFVSLAYLFVFNRRTRQSVHDLAVGTYVVRTSSPRAATPPTMWRGHFVAIGVLYFLLVGMAGLGMILLNTPFFQRMLTVREALLATGDARTATVTEGVTYFASSGHSGSARIYSVDVRWKKRSRSMDTLAEEIERLVLTADPSIANDDRLVISISYGYDIGIAWSTVSQEFSRTPAEWKNQLDLSR